MDTITVILLVIAFALIGCIAINYSRKQAQSRANQESQRQRKEYRDRLRATLPDLLDKQFPQEFQAAEEYCREFLSNGEVNNSFALSRRHYEDARNYLRNDLPTYAEDSLEYARNAINSAKRATDVLKCNQESAALLSAKK
jgi:hypothetical protein